MFSAVIVAIAALCTYFFMGGPELSDQKTEPQTGEGQAVSIPAPEKGRELQIQYLDAGQADATLIRLPNGQTMLIDAGGNATADRLVEYIAKQGVKRIDFLIGTHPHEDHIGGLDDVRAFNFVDYPPLVHKVDIYAAPHTLGVVRKDFDYAFAQDKYRGVPEIELHEIDVTRPFRVGGLEVVPVSGHHSDRFAVTGYRIGRLAYLTDFKTIGDAEVEKLRGVEVLVVNALRFTEHYSHFNVAEALALIARVAPREAYLTHMSHDIGLHAVTEPTLPRGVHMAYDTLQIEIND